MSATATELTGGETTRYVLVVPGSATDLASGGGQRSAIFASALARRGPVSVLVLGEADCDQVRATFDCCAEIRFAPLGSSAVPQAANSYSEKVARKLFEVMPRYRADAGVASTLNELVGEDRAVVVFRYFWPYCKSGLHWCKGHRILAMIDVDDRDDLAPLSLGRSMYRRLQSSAILDRAVRTYIRCLMGAMLSGAAHVWFVRAEDAADFADAPTSLAPNVPFVTAPQTLPPSEAEEMVLFVGNAAHASNVEGVRWFLTACWPKIRQARPSARFRLVGSGDWCGFLGELNSVQGIEIVGFVNDLAPEYAAARVVVSPVFEGGGTKIKVVEACAFGRPVVATRHSCRGFGSEIEDAIATAEDVSGFTAETTRLLAGRAEANELAEKLRRLQKRLLSREALEMIISGDAARVIEFGK